MILKIKKVKINNIFQISEYDGFFALCINMVENSYIKKNNPWLAKYPKEEIIANNIPIKPWNMNCIVSLVYKHI